MDFVGGGSHARHVVTNAGARVGEGDRAGGLSLQDSSQSDRFRETFIVSSLCAWPGTNCRYQGG